MKRLLIAASMLTLIGCGIPINIVTVPVDPPANTTPTTPAHPPTPEPTPPPPVEPDPAPPAPLQNLNIVVHDAAGAGISSAACAISGATETGRPESRDAHQAGDINFAVRGSVLASCSAKGYVSRSADLPPGDHRFALEAVPPTLEPAPPVVAPASLCAMRDSDPMGCVRQVAAVYPQLLQTNTTASATEFIQRVLEVLGPNWGHVGKPRGSHGVPKGFEPIEVNGYRIIGVAHDAIKHRDGLVVDILGNSTANNPCTPGVSVPPGEPCWKRGPARIEWHEVPPQDWRPENPFVPAVPVR